jgi:hypothetical protein
MLSSIPDSSSISPTESPPEDKMVFVSYASARRGDVTKLISQPLDKENISTWIDVEDIPPSVKWWPNIKRNIIHAQVFVFAISIESLGSPVCNCELDLAFKHKRVVAVKLPTAIGQDTNLLQSKARKLLEKRWGEQSQEQWKQILDVSFEELIETFEANWTSLFEINWIHAKENDEYFTNLINAVNKDFPYLEDHTDRNRRAFDWVESGKNPDSLLRGTELLDAEKWRDEKSEKDPRPTRTYVEFVSASRRSATQNQRRLLAMAIGLVLLFAILAIFANAFRIAAEQSRRETFEQLQTASVVSQSEVFPAQGVSGQPLLTGDSLWMSASGSGLLYRFALTTGQRIATIPTGIGASAPVSDGRFIWIASGEQVLQIDPADSQISHTFALGEETLGLIPEVDRGSVWAYGEESLTRIDGNEVKTYENLGDRIERILVDEEYVWLYDRRKNALLRFDIASNESVTVPNLTLNSGEMFRSGDHLWLIDRSTIYRIDRLNNQISWQHEFDGILTGYEHDDRIIMIGLQDQRKIVRIDTTAIEPIIHNHIQVNRAINQIHWLQNQLIVIAGDSQILTFNPDSGRMLTRTSLANASRFLAPVISQGHLWMVNSSTNTIARIRLDDGTRLPYMTHCDGPQSPLYDGSNIWLACNRSGTLMRLPADSINIPIEEYRRAEYPHPPIEINGSLWIPQESAGQISIVALDTQEVSAVLEFGGRIDTIIRDGNSLWVSTTDALITRVDIPGRRIMSSLQLESSIITGLLPVDDELWVSTSGTGSDIYRVRSDDTTIIWQANYGNQGATQPIYDRGIIWVGVSGPQGGAMLRFDARTGFQLSQQLLDGLSAPPIFTDEFAWAFEKSRGGDFPGTSAQTGGRLWRFSRSTGILSPVQPQAVFGQRIASMAEVAGQFWLTTSPLPPDLNAQTEVNANQLLVYDPISDRVHDVFDASVDRECNNLGEVYPAEQYVFVACQGIDSESQGGALVFDAQSRDLVHSYYQLGAFAWPWKECGQSLWLVFRDTGSAAILDKSSGNLIRQFGIGPDPSPLITSDTHVCDADQSRVFNASVGTIRYLQIIR